MFQSADFSDQRQNIPYSLKVKDKHQNIITIKQNSDYLILVLINSFEQEARSALGSLAVVFACSSFKAKKQNKNNLAQRRAGTARQHDSTQLGLNHFGNASK